ncbi:hypothetical protein Dvina_32020 [Dactylosporangium vinaceum]|uniref:Uncharacterized protein n=1 Tax=Dactylosporangium vinaceum TaxID=53362 RepID=A0ABV5MAN7_9ACTN|nr:hypothetical protein [Dactylosporangium vinaceum]UAB92923.1 hypothetical protein Dvina_32020 [Dactylosporangium vinaceum]
MVLVIASIPFGVMLLRAEDRRREVRFALLTMGLWLAGVLVIAAGSAWGVVMMSRVDAEVRSPA